MSIKTWQERAGVSPEIIGTVGYERAMQAEIDELRTALQERNALKEALAEYANPANWEEDPTGTRRDWLEPQSDTPRAYNGFELAQKAGAY